MIDTDDLHRSLTENTFYIDKHFLNGSNIEKFTILEPDGEFEDEKKYLNSEKASENIGLSMIFDRFNRKFNLMDHNKVTQIKHNTDFVVLEPCDVILEPNDVVLESNDVVLESDEEPTLNSNDFNSNIEENTKLSYRKMAELFEKENKFLSIDKALNIYDKKYGLFVPLDKENADSLIRRQSPEEIQDSLTKYAVNEIIAWVQSKTYWDKIDGEKLKQINSKYINFQNCTLELPSLKIYEHSPDFYCTNVLGIDYGEYYGNYSESIFFKMLDDFFGDDKNKMDLLQEIFAITISGIPLKHFYYFYGVPDSGKSKIADVLRYIVGSEYTSAITLKRFDTQFGLGGVYRKRLNIAGESNEVTSGGVEVVKRLTGGDYTLGEKKYEHAFEFYPQAALIFMSNHKLKVVDGQADQAFLNRMVVLEFSHSIPIEKQDTKLSLKLKQPSEINAIISWALQGIQRLYHNDFRLTQVVNPKNYVLSNSPTNLKNEREILVIRFREYLNETFDINPKNKEHYISVPDIFNDFRAYMGVAKTEDFEYKDSLCLHHILQDEYHLEKKRVKPTGQKKQLYVY